MDFIIRGNICYSKSPQQISVTDGGYLVCSGNECAGIYAQKSDIPGQYSDFKVKDYGTGIVIPGLCDLHTHAPQFANRGLGSGLQLLEWLGTYTYPEETKYSDLQYAAAAYDIFIDALKKSASTRACIFATVHLPATIYLMDALEKTGLATYTGLVNMDRNCPPGLCACNAADSAALAVEWIEQVLGKYENTKPILTPRFIPTCSDELMLSLKKLQMRYALPVQSHLSENTDEVSWVRELCPQASTYAGAYDSFGLLCGGNTRTVMAHCVWCTDEEKDIMRNKGVYVAHCPDSNMNLASGIAPARSYIDSGINMGLGSDISGGSHLSVFRAICDAIQVSKLYWRIIDSNCKPLSFEEAFYLATAGGGSFFGKVGKFEAGYEFDALVLDDSALPSPCPLTTAQRLERIAHLGEDGCVSAKFVRGKQIDLGVRVQDSGFRG